MQASIRLYTSEDKDNCIKAFVSNVPQYFTNTEITEFEKFLDSLYKGIEANYHVLTIDNKIIGCGGYGKRLNNNEIVLIWGFIDNSYHKKGLGKIETLYSLLLVLHKMLHKPMKV